MKHIFSILVIVFSISKASAASGTFNIQTNPIATLVGIINVELDYKINENITAGPTFSYLNMTILDVEAKAMSYGAQAKYYMSGAYNDGFYLGGTFSYGSFNVSAEEDLTGDELTTEASGLFYGVLGGYHWFWDSFNINLGLTLGASSIGEVEIEDENGEVEETFNADSSSTGLIFNIGFVF